VWTECVFKHFASKDLGYCELCDANKVGLSLLKLKLKHIAKRLKYSPEFDSLFVLRTILLKFKPLCPFNDMGCFSKIYKLCHTKTSAHKMRKFYLILNCGGC